VVVLNIQPESLANPELERISCDIRRVAVENQEPDRPALLSCPYVFTKSMNVRGYRPVGARGRHSWHPRLSKAPNCGWI
jgi:hypothetical protein